jgi:ribosomal protein S18 acetylase RimI-like enzyme
MLEDEGLVVTEPDASDKRVRTVRLTDAGRAEVVILDQRADQLARSLLESLTETHRSRLVAAMAVVEKLLTATLVELAVVDPAGDAAQFCLGSYFAELDVRFDGGFDLRQARALETADMTEPAGLLLLARLHDEPIGCGALRFHGEEPAEIKRMWVAASARGLGVGRRLLDELERHARRRGVPALRLDTNRSLVEAINLYRSVGFVEVEPFNDEHYADHWFEKKLSGA